MQAFYWSPANCVVDRFMARSRGAKATTPQRGLADKITTWSRLLPGSVASCQLFASSRPEHELWMGVRGSSWAAKLIGLPHASPSLSRTSWLIDMDSGQGSG